MLKKVVRLGDPTEHGTPLGPGPGSEFVFLGGRPIWRAGLDMHKCGVLADGIGTVIPSSDSWVFVEGIPIVVEGDIVTEIPGAILGKNNRILSGCDWVCLQTTTVTNSLRRHHINANQLPNSHLNNLSRNQSSNTISYLMKVQQREVYGKGKYKNADGKTECVEFVRRVTDAPTTMQWRAGQVVKGSLSNSIPTGTAIATFDENGKYPNDSLGRHAAIYLRHDDNGIYVLDQWNARGEVKESYIRFGRQEDVSRSRNADTYSIISIE